MSKTKKNRNDISRYPNGFSSYVTNVGVKNTEDDLVVVFSEAKCMASGVFTKSTLPGPAVRISKENIKNKEAQALIVVSKNANVATGLKGYQDANRIVEAISSQLGIKKSLVQIAGTGVIGRRYPIEKIMQGLSSLRQKLVKSDFFKVANGIRTTDKSPKMHSKKIGKIVLTGVAKGVGMIEPNMATLLAYFFTDAEIDKDDLDRIFKKVMNKTFNCMSIDTDTSTSDSAVIFANGLSGRVNLLEFEEALYEIAFELMVDILKDGEGSSKVMEVNISNAKSYLQARTIGKSIINSPLVKTAIHGADPNWGRIIMAIGKCTGETGLSEDKIQIRICDFEVYPKQLDEKDLSKLKKLMEKDFVGINVALNTGKEKATVWGCDLTCEYVRFNSAYTT